MIPTTAGGAAKRRLLLNWRQAFGFVFELGAWKSNLFWGGFWILVFPPAGWLMALGYRKHFAFNLVEGQPEPLPGWQSWKTYLADGVRAALVILAYFTPFMLVYWTLALESPADVVTHWRAIALFVIAIPALIPICLPVLPPLYWYLFPWVSLTPVETVIVGLVFWSTAFIMPSAFMQVSLYRTFKASLHVPRVLTLIVRDFRLYLEAWVISLIATGFAFATLLVAPWGIFWSYLVIGYAFNNVLAFSRDPHCRRQLATATLFKGR